MKKNGKRSVIFAAAAVLVMSLILPGLASSDLLLVQANDNLMERQLSSQKDSKKKPRVIYSKFNRNTSVIMVGKGDMNGYEWKKMNSILKSPAPRTTSHIKSIAGKKVKKIVFKNTLCGVLAEPSKTGKFELDYTGIKEKDMFTVSTKISKGVLTVTTKGKADSENFFIDTDPDHLINTIRVRIPVKKYGSIKVTGDCGNTLLRNISAPVSGNVRTGGVKIVKNNLKHSVRMSCTSGNVVLVSKNMKAEYQLTAGNGDALVYGGRIAAKGELSCSNGDVGLEADEISKPAQLSTQNGDVYFNVTKVNGKTKLSCTNGDITAEIGTLLKNMSVRMDNGDGSLTFKKKPENLTYRGPKADDCIGVPKGWQDGWRIGTGKPVLSVKMKNGNLNISYAGNK